MAFQKLEIKRNAWHKLDPFVSCTAHLYLSFNSRAVEEFEMEQFDSVFVHHDPDRNMVGFELVKGNPKGSLRLTGKDNSRKSTAFMFAGAALKKQYNVPIDALKKSPLFKEGSLLVAKLEPGSTKEKKQDK